MKSLAEYFPELRKELIAVKEGAKESKNVKELETLMAQLKKIIDRNRKVKDND